MKNCKGDADSSFAENRDRQGRGAQPGWTPGEQRNAAEPDFSVKLLPFICGTGH
jgi:hypothetical protein